MNINIDAKEREIGRRSDLNKLRSEGYIPGVIYGAGKKGVNILLEKLEFNRKYKKSIGEVAFYEITVGGKTYTTILKSKQIHPVKRNFVHIDFMELKKGHKITIEIPLQFVGEAAGEAEGGVVDILIRKLKVSSLPKDVPDNIKVDISALKIGDSLSVADLDLTNLETELPEDTTIVNITTKMSEEEYEASLQASTDDEEELEEGTTEEETEAPKAE